MAIELERLGRRLAARQDEQLASLEPICYREKKPVEKRPHRKALLASGIAAAALVVSAVVLLNWLQRPPESELASYTIDGEPAEVGAWVSAAAGLTMDFPERSQVQLTSDARARVLELSAASARVLVEQGSLHASINPNANRRWLFVAGPFEVRVTGTEFGLDWDSTGARLTVSVSAGSVVVRGCSFGGGRRITTGNTMSGVCDVSHEPSPDSAPAEESGVGRRDVDESQEQPLGEHLSAREAASSVRPQPVHPQAAAWEREAEVGRYREAMLALDDAEFRHLCETASEEDLRELAQIARLADSVARAEAACRSLRRRFAGTPTAAVAAFTLGRIEAEQKGNHAAAVVWFEKFLDEQPGSVLAQDALGRLMEAYIALEQPFHARRLAKRYLKAYPKGAHAKLASQLDDAAKSP